MTSGRPLKSSIQHISGKGVALLLLRDFTQEGANGASGN